MTTVAAASLDAFIRNVLRKIEADAYTVDHVAEGLVQTSLRGVDSHGVRLFPHYVRAANAGRLNKNPKFRFQGDYSAASTLYADDAFGHAAGAKAMEYAIDKSGETGVCAVGVRDSSHFGAAAYYALMAADKGLIGMSFTNADALVVPTRGVRPFFGTNPICFAAPVKGRKPFCLDMATSMLNWNKVKRHREQREPLPPETAADEQGRTTTDADAARALRPAGDYKGYGLGAMVDILCALLPGGPFGPHLLPMFTAPLEKQRHIGHFFIAMRPDAFAGGEGGMFETRMAEMVAELATEPKFGDLPVLAAGDPEWAHMEEREKSGIPLSPAEADDFAKLGEETGVEWAP